MTAPSFGEVASRHGTDKVAHGYAPVYETLLGPRRGENLTLLEIGVAAGRSLRTWLEWLPRATVIGLDCTVAAGMVEEILKDVPAGRGRLTVYRGRQEDWHTLRQAFPPGSLDVVVDDGSHVPWQQAVSVLALWTALRPGGIYVLEDVHRGAEALLSQLPGFAEVVTTGPRYDDRLVVLRK